MAESGAANRVNLGATLVNWTPTSVSCAEDSMTLITKFLRKSQLREQTRLRVKAELYLKRTSVHLWTPTPRSTSTNAMTARIIHTSYESRPQRSTNDISQSRRSLGRHNNPSHTALGYTRTGRCQWHDWLSLISQRGAAREPLPPLGAPPLSRRVPPVAGP